MSLSSSRRRRVPTANPDIIASRADISGFFSTTSYTAEQMSTDKSMTAPAEPMNIDATNIWGQVEILITGVKQTFARLHDRAVYLE